jgi:hypothetical protein
MERPLIAWLNSGADGIAAVALLLVLLGVIVTVDFSIAFIPMTPRDRRIILRALLFLAVGAAIVGFGNRFGISPDFDRLSYGGELQQGINGIGAFSLLLSLVLIIVGGAMWAIGSLSGLYKTAEKGRLMTLYAVVLSISIGAAATMVNSAFSVGSPAP